MMTATSFWRLIFVVSCTFRVLHIVVFTFIPRTTHLKHMRPPDFSTGLMSIDDGISKFPYKQAVQPAI
jgi:hypothetical protein